MSKIVLLQILLIVLAVFIALSSACALRVGRRRRTGASQVAADPFFYPFGEVPIVPRERHLIAGDFSAWGIPNRSPPSAGALRRNERGGRPESTSGTAVVLSFPGRRA